MGQIVVHEEGKVYYPFSPFFDADFPSIFPDTIMNAFNDRLFCLICSKLEIMPLRSFTRVIMVSMVVILVAACKKADTDKTYLEIVLVDNPYEASEVNIDVQKVRINFSTDSTSWIDLSTKAGVYNLLDYQNGNSVTIAQGIVRTDQVRQIRFVLGSNNSIKVDNDVYALKVPSGSESGIRVRMKKQLKEEFDTITIDFDSAISIYQDGAGEYIFKPIPKNVE